MSCIYQCDRCGKIISDADFIRKIPSKEPEHSEEMLRYTEASRLALFSGQRKTDLCLGCQMQLLDWLHHVNNKEVQND